jgi:hypothetical protein
MNAPAAAIYRLIQDSDVFLESLHGGEAVAEFLSCVPVVAVDPTIVNELIGRFLKMNRTVPAYCLHFRPDDTFWGVVEQMRG